MTIIDIKKDFSPTTGFRTYEDGEFSGQEFFDRLLDVKFQEAISNGEKLQVILDGGEGYTSSFLNESFRLLGKKYGSDNVWSNLIVISNEWPKYIQKIKDSVYEMEK